MQAKLAKEEAEVAVRDLLLILRAGCSFARKMCALNFWKHVRSSSAGPENAHRSAGAARVRAAEPREEGGQRRWMPRSFAPFYILKNHHFSKTGSGQT